MAFNFSPKVNTNGLILHLDAANPKSYVSGSTTWDDLSRGRNNGTLSAGITFSNNTLVYNSSQIVTIPMTNLRPTTGITQECWFLITTNTTQIFIGAQYGNGSNNSYALWIEPANTVRAGINIAGSFNTQAQSVTLTTNIYYHFLHTYDGLTQRMYLNGSEIRSWATTGTIAYDLNNTLLAVGNDWNSGYDAGASFGVQGRLAIVRIYNRSLSPTEVLQNYNATKGRFGL